MHSTVVRASDTRRIETPGATMTTLASPTLGATAELSLWKVAMAADAEGPLHTFDSEQLWTVLEGDICASIAAEDKHLSPGDTVVIPAGVARQITATSDTHLLVCGRSNAVARVVGEDHPRGTPAWIA
jgi:quercetin dioxygenase-like cupin family protein